MDPLSWKDPLLEPRAMGAVGGGTGENMAFLQKQSVLLILSSLRTNSDLVMLLPRGSSSPWDITKA